MVCRTIYLVLQIMNLVVEFDKLVRMIQRQHNVSEPIPPFYVRTLISLENSVNTALAKEKEAKKKTNATNAKALTAMKQKVKKSVKEYEMDVNKYNAVSPFWAPTSELNSGSGSRGIRTRVHRPRCSGYTCGTRAAHRCSRCG